MSDVSLRDQAMADLKQTTLGWNKVKNYAPERLATTNWGKGLDSLAQISAANKTPRDAAVGYLKRTTAGYSPQGTYWKRAFAELAKIVDAAPPASKPSIPYGLAATPGDAKVTLRWSANPAADGVDAYQIYEADEPDAGYISTAAQTVVVTKDHTGAALVNGRAYSFRVSAHNAQGYGDWSPFVAATPVGSTPPSSAVYPSPTRYPSEVLS